MNKRVTKKEKIAMLAASTVQLILSEVNVNILKAGAKLEELAIERMLRDKEARFEIIGMKLIWQKHPSCFFVFNDICTEDAAKFLL